MQLHLELHLSQLQGRVLQVEEQQDTHHHICLEQMKEESAYFQMQVNIDLQVLVGLQANRDLSQGLTALALIAPHFAQHLSHILP